MKRMIYQVYVGDQSNLYDWCIESVGRYCHKYDLDHKIIYHPKLVVKPDIFNPRSNRSKESWNRLGYLPIFEKEYAFTYFDRFDQIAIVDSDIYIRKDAPNIFDELKAHTDFAGVLERSLPITQQHQQKILNYSKMQYGPLTGEIPPERLRWNPALGAAFYNMGLMVMNKSITKYLRGQDPYSFIMRPEFKRFVDGEGAWKWSTDQTLLNYWVMTSGMQAQDLDWKYNALYGATDSGYTKQAHFIHFFLKDKLPQRGENVEQLMKDIA